MLDLITRTWSLLIGFGKQIGMTFFTTWFWRGIPIPNHAHYGYDHPDDHVKIQPFSPEKCEPKNQNKYGFHMAQNLEGDSGESSNADELAEIGPYCNCAGYEYESLHR